MSQSQPAALFAPHPRIIATLATIPLVLGATVIGVILSESFLLWPYDSPWRRLRELLVTLVPTLGWYALVLWIWRPTVAWTPVRRRRMLWVNGGLAALVLLDIAAALAVVDRYEAAPLSWGVTAIGIAAALTLFGVITWTPPAAGIADLPVPCPACRFDLRAAKSCTCPTCGRETSLGELARTTAIADALELADAPAAPAERGAGG